MCNAHGVLLCIDFDLATEPDKYENEIGLLKVTLMLIISDNIF